jgi:hypothetical protein|tara:strand:+ start:1739 stop:1960 length:222 start_codon:yes stop_codon:yes gene_type:complete
MTIKQNGGVFGRNPTFNDVTIEGQLTFISYADLTEEVVKNWVTDSVDATAIEVGLDNILLEMQTPSTQSGLPW